MDIHNAMAVLHLYYVIIIMFQWSIWVKNKSKGKKKQHSQASFKRLLCSILLELEEGCELNMSVQTEQE